MSAKHSYRSLLWVLRIVLTIFVILDCTLIGYLAFHYFRGGADGVRAWIVHVEQVRGPLVWRESGSPTELAVREVMSAYEHFAMLVVFLGFGTWLAWRLHGWVKNRLKILPAPSSTTGPAAAPMATTEQGR
jgi:hypothetical protein